MNRLRLFYSAAVFTLQILFATSAQAQAQHVRLTNLPHVYINTFYNRSITSKDVYIYATMWYVDENDEVTQYDSLEIRGRGNSTWGLAKKPYKLKFHVKEKLLGKGRANAKKWTLLANAADKTLMRNAITSEMGAFLGLPFNPAAKFVDLTLNGTYLGNYQISDQVEVRSKRVDVEEQDYPLTADSDITGGYLLEVDGFYDGNCFTTNHGVPIRIHYPEDDEIAPEQNNYIRQYMRNFETVLFGSDFADPEKGYRQWVDSVSLANWLIATEVSANIDGYYSTYFYKHRDDSLLYWGPLWDYDIAYDNDYRIAGNVQKLMTDVGYGQTKEWINRMWNDPWFGKLINTRYQQAVADGLEAFMMQKIDSISDLLQESQTRNYQKWGIRTRMYHENVLYSSYDQYVQDLKSFISAHMAWLSTAFADKKPEEPTPPFAPENYYYRIRNANSSTVLDLTNNTYTAYDETNPPAPNTPVVAWAIQNTRPSQEWQITPVGNYFFIQNRLSGLALTDPTPDPSTATTNTGTQLIVALPDSTDDRQLWTIVPQGVKGYYNLTNLHTDHTANLSGGSASNGTFVLSYTTDERNSTSTNRLWYFTLASALPEKPTEPDAIGSHREPDAYALAYNPVLKQLHFGAEDPSQLTFQAQVLTADGRIVGSFRADETYSTSHLANGIYVVTWKVGGIVRSTKFRR